jgi:predicted AAA+ superfamily ATPase
LRYIAAFIRKSLEKRAVFIGGPRQVGKTTLALSLISPKAGPKHPAYLSWDHGPSSEKIRKTELPPNQTLLVFDELHKFKLWKRWIKGVIDVEKGQRKIVVTGSARLDLYQKGGDSLFGRYRYARLHPYSINELRNEGSKLGIDDLLRFGGFPEPLFSRDARELKLWQKERLRRVIREDVRDLQAIQNITGMELLAETLPNRVGSPLSVQSLSEDIQVDHKTIKRWIEVLESMYFCYRLPPFGAKKIRAVKKEQKLYLWDWSVIADPGARWENLVASQLLKYCHWIEDSEGETMELRYIRDIDKREVDFVVMKNNKPLFAVECKSGEKSIGAALHYFAERTDIPAFYQVHRGNKHYQVGKIIVIPFVKFCRDLSMP